MGNAMKMFPIHRLWPEATCVWMQGLPTPGRLTDPEGKKAGWQGRAGDQGDRDLKFLDAVLATLRTEQKVDDRRIYATGHSNGGGFTYLLWAERGDVFAAMAPSGAAASRLSLADLKPKPVLHIAGKADKLVRFAWQAETMAALRVLNGCGSAEKGPGGITRYPSSKKIPVVTLIHPGGHAFPPQAVPQIVAFFKAHPGEK
jgi:polyhydroxybutyrate depolymerase